MNANVVHLIEFVLRQSEGQPLRNRIKLYRGLAEICGDEREAKLFVKMASDLEEADRRCSEFIFSVLHKTTDGGL